MKLRNYQIDILTQYRQARNFYNSIVIQLPTGAGKSVIANEIIIEHINKGLQVAVLVPNCTLVNNMLKYMPEQATIAYNGVIPDLTKPVLISTYQSTKKYLAKMPSLGLIITDECHHAVATNVKKILKHYKHIHSVGFTATTRRLDKYGLDQVYTKLITSYPIGWFIENGYLCDFEVIVPNDNLINFTNLKDFENDILSLLKQLPQNETLYDLWANTGLIDKKTIIFNVDIQHSKTVDAYFKSKGVKSYHIDGTMPESERTAVIKLFQQGKINVICNVKCLTEGVDIPEIDCVIQNNFFRSEIDFYQTLGRGLRIHGENKILKVLDMARNFYYHGNPKNDKFWDIHTKTSVKPKKSKHIKYCAYCEAELGYVNEIWPNELLSDVNFFDYTQKKLCCLSPGCLSHTITYDDSDFCIDTLVTYTPKYKGKNPTRAIFSQVDTFDNLNLDNAELASILLSKATSKKKIERIIDLKGVSISAKVSALLSMNIPKSNILEYLDVDFSIDLDNNELQTVNN